MSENTNGKTMMFPVQDLRDREMHDTLSAVYEALRAKGYDPVNQLVGYFISEDPTYITNHNNARALIRKLDRDEVLSAMIKTYLDIKE
ncbi:MAG: IreB family regulatory phosphoprotein [Clostridia bacterium]|nr:IreB family regulatory phosphoprotein [Clostridia bacterium]